MKSEVSVTELYYCIQGNTFAPFYFCPFRCRCQRANLRVGEFLCLILFLLKHISVWANLRQGDTVFNEIVFLKKQRNFDPRKMCASTVYILDHVRDRVGKV